MPVQISGRELVKALTKDGWETVRVSGSHHVREWPRKYHPACILYPAKIALTSTHRPYHLQH